MEYVVVYFIASVIALMITFIIIRSAVRAAMIEHYKIVRWYEGTGEWRTTLGHWKDAPRDLALASTDVNKKKKSV
jgi:hypothetical protein